MSSQGNNINGKTPKIKKFTNAELLSELTFFEKHIKLNN